MNRWTLRTAATSYTVEVPEHGQWAELSSWGPIGVEDGPSPLAGHGRTPFRTAADAAPAEYLPLGQRPFGGAELDVRRPGIDRGAGGRSPAPNPPTGRTPADVHGRRARPSRSALLPDRARHDVIRRWIELTNTGSVT